MSDEQGRPESETARLERNWTELLQELRVIQTGTQILTGFLLTLPFQAQFPALTPFQRILYLCLVIGAALATVLALAPVSVHRALFRLGDKRQIVATGNGLAIVTLAVVALVLTGTVTFVFDVVVGDAAALVVGIAALVGLASLWVALPLGIRARGRSGHSGAGHSRSANSQAGNNESGNNGTGRP